MDIIDPSTFQTIKSGFDLVKSALGVAKDIKDLTKNPEQAQAAERKIAEAERALQLGEAQIAQALGYKLCKCSFPPTIMTSKGVHPKRLNEIFVCSSCGAENPSVHHFNKLDEEDRAINEYNERL